MGDDIYARHQMFDTQTGLYTEVLANPLLHIFSVRIDTNIKEYGIPCEIYGSIRATEDGGSSFDLYDRDIAQPETIWGGHGTLSLSGPKDDAILGSRGVTIDICLKDRNRDIELIKVNHYLNPVLEGIEDSFDRLTKVVIEGKYCIVHLYYTRFRFATFAIVEIAIFKEDKEIGLEGTNLYGSLVASYSNSRKYCGGDDELKYLETVLFEKPANQPTQVMVGTTIKLQRCLVAMPAYSSLVITGNFFESKGQFVNGFVDFPAEDDRHSAYAQFIESENGRVRVKVTFHNSYMRINKERTHKERMHKGSIAVALENTHESQSEKEEDPSKKARVTPQPLNAVKIWGEYRVEVFSVYIGGINSEVSTFWGTIEVDDGTGKPFYIYNTEWNDHEVLQRDKIASLGGSIPISNAEFFIYVDLKDPIQKVALSKGMFWWNAGTIDQPISWFGKRMCSVVRGASGYAALHYMIFESAISAYVELTFFCDTLASSPIDLYGDLLTWYGGHEYPTDYDKKYYRSRLFNMPQNKPLQLSNGCKVPLIKSVVAVPINSSLVVEADLKAEDSSVEDLIHDQVVFKIDPNNKICEEIRGQHFRIEVSVIFTED